MRSLPVLIVLAMLLPAVPPAGAQAPAHEARAIDPPGDVMLSPYLVGNVTKSPSGDHVDILSVWLANETDDTFEAGIALAKWVDPFESDMATQRAVLITFQYGRHLFGARLLSPGLAEAYRCKAGQALLVEPNFGRESAHVNRQIGCLNQTTEPEKGIAKVQVEKKMMGAFSKIPVVAGESVRGVMAVAEFTVGFVGRSGDRAPNTGLGPDLLLRHGGVKATGHLLLSSPTPGRASNGESTTMVFPLELRNEGDRQDAVHLRVENANPDWTIRVPERVTVAANEVTSVPLILSMNFTHLHGVTQELTVRAESSLVPDVFSELTLSVHWLTVPQPAGHHDRLWLHSKSLPNWGMAAVEPMDYRPTWMNAQEKDPAATDEPAPARVNDLFVGQGLWMVPLDPVLAIGLDFDMVREGQLVTRTLTSLPSQAATLHAQLIQCTKPIPDDLHDSSDCAAADRLILGEGKLGPRPLAAGASTPWEVVLKFKPAADLVPFRPGSNLFLRIVLEQEAPTSALFNYRAPTPRLVVKDSQLVLPLNEYHDPVDQAFQNVGTLSVNVVGPIEKNLNPGRASLFRLEVKNGATLAQHVQLSVEGINREWARLDRSDSIELAPGAAATVAVLVKAPEDAAAGERAELFVVAQSKSDASVVALARLRATVVDPTVSSIPHEEAPSLDADAVDKTPNVGLAAVMIALASGAFVRNRRQRPA